MATGECTSDEAEASEEALLEIMRAFPEAKVGAFIGHFNDIAWFLASVKAHLKSQGL